MQNVSWVSITEVGCGDIDDGHVVTDLHLLINAGQVVGLTDIFIVHLSEVHGSMVQFLATEIRQVDIIRQTQIFYLFIHF